MVVLRRYSEIHRSETPIPLIQYSKIKFLFLRSKVYACDGFKWQNWMNNFAPKESCMQDGKSFLDKFLLSTKNMIDRIEPVVMNFDNELPEQLRDIKIDFIVIDFTQDPNELQKTWNLFKNKMIANHTIVIINGLSKMSIPFLTNVSDQLKPIAKPHTIAKAFIYQGEEPKHECDYEVPKW